MKAFVTGATGFIGQHLIERLQRGGWNVHAFVRTAGTLLPTPTLKVIIGDLLDRGSLASGVAGCETVFHLAGKVHDLSKKQEDDVAYQSVNVEGARNVVEASVVAGVRRFLFFSSVKAMGEVTQGCDDETVQARPVTAYGRSKLAAEELVLSVGRSTGLDVVCLRLPLVYGSGMKGNLLRMIAAIDRGIFPPLPDSPARRSMVHVGDVVEAALLAARSSASSGQRYIVTDTQLYSPVEIYRAIVQALGKRVPRWSVPLWGLKTAAKVGDAISWATGKPFVFDSDILEKLIGPACYSAEKIMAQLGYRPSLTFPQALPEMVASYRKSQG